MHLAIPIWVTAAIAVGEAYHLVSEFAAIPIWASALVINSVLSVPALPIVRHWAKTKSHARQQPNWIYYYLPGPLILLCCLICAAYLPAEATTPTASPGLPRLTNYQLAAITIIPIVEELAFRITISQAIQRNIPGFWGCYFSALLFSFMHSTPTFTKLIDLEIGIFFGPFLLGLVNELLVRRLRMIGPSIALHACCNATVLVFSWLSPDWLDRLSWFYH